MFPHTTRVALWVVVIGLLVVLFAPFVPFKQAAAGVVAAGIVTLAVISVIELIRAIARPCSVQPPWTPGGEYQAESRIHRVGCNPDGSDCIDDGLCTHCPHGFPNGRD